MLVWTQFGRVRELTPIRGTMFRFKEDMGTTLEFLRDAGGKVDRIAVLPPGGDPLMVKRVK